MKTLAFLLVGYFAGLGLLVALAAGRDDLAFPLGAALVISGLYAMTEAA